MADSIIIKPAQRVCGEITVPADKSITHRALMMAAIATGKTIIHNPSPAIDCQSTVQCLREMGVDAVHRDNAITVYGKTRQGLQKPSGVLNAGNSGSTLRMIAGIIAGQPIRVTIDGDNSLRKRPFKRVAEPLAQMGATITGTASSGGEMVCPIHITGSTALKPIIWETPVASAQVKTAILFAGLNAAGKTTVREPRLSRDHTERMLAAFGCSVTKKASCEVSIAGPVQLVGAEVRVPGDFSSAAFFLVLGLLKPQSSLMIKGVCVNPTRTGLIAVLKRMGADIIVSNQTVWGGEPVGDIMARYQPLTATTVNADEIPALIDEIPVLAVAAAYARGTTVISGAGELKHKESNRLAAIADGLKGMGALVEVTDDGLIITGRDELRGDARVDSFDDHRIAMSLAIGALQAKNAVEILRPRCVDISFPGFWEMLSAYAS